MTWVGVLDKYCESDDVPVQPQILIQPPVGSAITATPLSMAFTPSVLGVGTKDLTFSFTDALTGCTSTITKQVKVNADPILNFVDLEDSYCQQSFIVTLKGNPTGGSFRVNGNPATQLDPKTFAVGDKPVVDYIYTDANSCDNVISKEVEITPADAFTPTTEDLDVCPNPQYFLQALTEAEENAFKTSGITPVYYWLHTPSSFRQISITDKAQAGKYEVTVRDQDGCPIAQKTFNLKVDCEPKLFVPTAFTPNGDRHNELFKIFGEDFAKLDFKVYNRWGEVIFTARKKEETWDGNIKGKPAPAGVYAWSVTFENTLKRGEIIRKQGQFMLIR